jgi:hemerythrin-like domain-containing protein
LNQLAITHLLAEHRETEEYLRALEELFEAASPWSAAAMESFERICAFFDRDVVCHIRKEDEGLFPVLEEFLPRDVGPLAVLRGEHAEIATNYSLMRHAGDALRRSAQKPQARADFQRYGRKLVLLVHDHIYKEDRVLYPMVARLLSAEQDRTVLLHMEGIIIAAKSQPVVG